MPITLYPNAKVNLGLRVLGERPDGYHDIDTVFLPVVGLHDVLTLHLLPGEPTCTLEVSGGGDCGAVRDNLIVKAYELLRPYTPPAVRVELRKQIPVGAGLGGGSSDGAFALAAIAQRCQRAVGTGLLAELALELGSDCPFFLLNRPALGQGRGERLRSVSVPIAGFWLLLVTPPVHVSTGWAFGQLEGSGSLIPVDEAIAKPLNEWQGLLLNDFQRPIARAIPQVAEVLERMATLAPSYYALSGSGPSVFGLFPRCPECPESLFSECHVSVTQLTW